MIWCQGLIITISNTVRWSKICTGKTSLMNRLTSQSVSRTTVLAYLLFIFSISVIKAILIVKVVIKWLLIKWVPNVFLVRQISSMWSLTHL